VGLIVVDTSVLVYAVGTDHPLREPCRRLIAAIGDRIDATTTVEVIQEFAHVRARRRTRPDAASLARSYITTLSPLMVPTTSDVVEGLALFQENMALDCFDAVLAATCVARGADALVSADRAFDHVPGLNRVDPSDPELDRLLGANT